MYCRLLRHILIAYLVLVDRCENGCGGDTVVVNTAGDWNAMALNIRDDGDTTVANVEHHGDIMVSNVGYDGGGHTTVANVEQHGDIIASNTTSVVDTAMSNDRRGDNAMVSNIRDGGDTLASRIIRGDDTTSQGLLDEVCAWISANPVPEEISEQNHMKRKDSVVSNESDSLIAGEWTYFTTFENTVYYKSILEAHETNMANIEEFNSNISSRVHQGISLCIFQYLVSI